MKAQTKGWKDETMDEEIFGQMLDENITVCANHLVKYISSACDAAIARRRSAFTRRPVYWWNSEIALLRRDYHSARRRYKRSEGESDNEILRAVFKAKRKELKAAINRS